METILLWLMDQRTADASFLALELQYCDQFLAGKEHYCYSIGLDQIWILIDQQTTGWIKYWFCSKFLIGVVTT